jgi:hypothetical protein
LAKNRKQHNTHNSIPFNLEITEGTKSQIEKYVFNVLLAILIHSVTMSMSLILSKESKCGTFNLCTTLIC